MKSKVQNLCALIALSLGILMFAAIVGTALGVLSLYVGAATGTAIETVTNLSQGTPVFFGAEVVGQEEAEVGELVRFLAEGDIVKWECLPASEDSESYGEHGENYVISFRKPGVYTIVAAVYTEGDLSISQHQITVKGPVVVIPDVVIPDEVSITLVQRAQDWAVKYNIDRETLEALSTNFQKIVREIEDGDLTSPGDVIVRTVKINRRLDIDEGLIAELQAYLTSQADAGNLKTLDQHRAVWSAISQGFKNAADLL